MTATLATPRVLAPWSRRALRACGYDDAIVARLAPADARFFVRGAALSLLASGLSGASVAYGAVLTIGGGWAPLVLVAVAAFVLNLLRLHHAGSGYPLHLPIEDIGAWRPAGAALVVLFALGMLLTQPMVLLLVSPALEEQLAARAAAARVVQEGLGVLDPAAPVAGLIARSRAAWEQHPGTALAASVILSLVVAAPTLLRRTGARAVRLYESERWIAERELVDEAWAENIDAVTALLTETAPGFSGQVQMHHADPPYNTRPLLFGLDPARVVAGRIHFVRPSEPIEAAPALPPPSTTSESAVSAAAPRGGVAAPASLDEQLSSSLAHTVIATPGPIEESWAGHTAIDAGRMTTAQARGDIPGLVLFLTLYLERPREEVLRALADAPADAPLFKVFPEWNKLPTVLLKSAGFALDAGLAPLIAIAVDKPVIMVERRLRAAPRDKKVSSVFAPELARRLLRSGT